MNKISIGFIALTMLAGCTTKAVITKTERFAHYDSEGKPTYFQIVVFAEGRNGKVDYRSGWYDARAVDALFGDVSFKADLDAATAHRRKEAIQKTFDNYMKALEETPTETAEIESAQNAYNKALESISGVVSAGESPTKAIDHASEKFVIIFANDPDEIIKTIREAGIAGEMSDLVGNLGMQEYLSRTSTLNLERDFIVLELGQKESILKEARETVASEDAITAKDMKKRLERLITILEN